MRRLDEYVNCKWDNFSNAAVLLNKMGKYRTLLTTKGGMTISNGDFIDRIVENLPNSKFKDFKVNIKMQKTIVTLTVESVKN